MTDVQQQRGPSMIYGGAVAPPLSSPATHPRASMGGEVSPDGSRVWGSLVHA